jgi:hypothetical protein
MSILAVVGLMVLTLAAAYALWSLLLRAEQLYTQLERHGQTAADRVLLKRLWWPSPGRP